MAFHLAFYLCALDCRTLKVRRDVRLVAHNLEAVMRAVAVEEWVAVDDPTLLVEVHLRSSTVREHARTNMHESPGVV